MNPRDDLPGDDVPQDATISRLYRELPDDAPSPDTDARILAAARRAVGAGPRRGGFVAAHWRGVGSAAAALLLGVALTVQWRTQQAGRLEETLATAPPPAAAPAPVPGAARDTATSRDDTAIDALFADASAPAAEGAAAPAAPVAAEAAAKGRAEAVAKADAAARATARARAETGDAATAGAATGAARVAGTGMNMKKEAADSLAMAPAAPAASSTGGAPAAPAPMSAPVAAPMPAPNPAVAAEAPAPARRQAERKMLAQEAVPAERQEARIAAAPAAASPAPARAGEGVAATAAAPAMAGNVARADAARDMAAAPAAKAAAASGPTAQARPAHARLMAEGRYAEALDALAAPATPEAVVDRDLLRQWLQPGAAPACATTPGLGAQALLCDGLRQRAAGGLPTAAWRAALERAGLASGAFAYRRDLVDKVFGPARP